MLDGVPALQQTAHRVVWSVPILVAAVVLPGRRARLRAATADRRTVALTVVAGALLTTNWAVFVWTISADRIVDASLG